MNAIKFALLSFVVNILWAYYIGNYYAMAAWACALVMGIANVISNNVIDYASAYIAELEKTLRSRAK